MRGNRISKMEDYIREKRVVSLDELCEYFGVSKNTVRRDINEIVSRSDICKVYGGVSVERSKIPPPFNERSNVNLGAKELIGECAAKLVEDGDIIYVDSGTTTSHLIDNLTGKKNITVITHSLDVINRAVENPEISVISLSGTLNRKTFSFTGQSTIDVLKDYNISKAFMAANGVTIQNGATQSTSIEFAIKKTVVSRSDTIILMIENHKFGGVSLLTYCNLRDIDMIVTNKKPFPEFIEAYEAMGGKLIVPEE